MELFEISEYLDKYIDNKLDELKLQHGDDGKYSACLGNLSSKIFVILVELKMNYPEMFKKVIERFKVNDK